MHYETKHDFKGVFLGIIFVHVRLIFR